MTSWKIIGGELLSTGICSSPDSFQSPKWIHLTRCISISETFSSMNLRAFQCRPLGQKLVNFVDGTSFTYLMPVIFRLLLKCNAWGKILLL